MGDNNYELAYKKKKKELRKMHEKLKVSRKTQEIYHNIMGTAVEDKADSADSED